MSTKTALQQAIHILGQRPLQRACGLKSKNAVANWNTIGKLPHSDLTGETNYSEIIEDEMRYNGSFRIVTRAELFAAQLDDMKPGQLYKVPVELLRRDPAQPRTQFDLEKLQELAESIKANGQETSIRYRLLASEEKGAEDGTPLVIVHGERRWRAIQLAGIDHVYGVFDAREDEAGPERIMRQIADNEQHEKHSPWDFACICRDLHNNHNMTHQAIADLFQEKGIKGMSRPVVSNYVRLFTLPKWAQKHIEDGWLTPSHGKYLLQLVKHDQVFDVLEKRWNGIRANDGGARPVGSIDLEVRDAYEKIFPEIGGIPPATEGIPGIPDYYCLPFDISTCDGCKDIHVTTLGNGHEDKFCLNIACCAAKAAEAEKELEQQHKEFDSKQVTDYDADLEAEISAPASTNPQYTERPEIGARVYMPRKPIGYMSDRHPRGARIGTVIDHPKIFDDSVTVKYDATTKASITETNEIWRNLRPATAADEDIQRGETKAKQIAEEQQKRRGQSEAQQQKLRDAVGAGGGDVQLAILMMYHLNDTDDHDPESLSTWMKVILPGSKEKNLAEAAISAAGDLYFDEDAHGLLRYFDIKDDSTQSGNQLDAFKS